MNFSTFKEAGYAEIRKAMARVCQATGWEVSALSYLRILTVELVILNTRHEGRTAKRFLLSNAKKVRTAPAERQL